MSKQEMIQIKHTKFAISVLILLGGITGLAQQTCLGDVNLDSRRDVQDTVRVLRHVNGLESFSGQALVNADVDQNGTVNLQDVGRLRNHIIGLQPVAPCAPGTDPRITTISPTRGVSATTVTISGINFGSTAASNTVQFNNETATIQSAGSTQLVVTAPTTSGGGFVRQVTVTTGGKTSNSKPFIFDRFEPEIHVEPLSVLAGSSPPVSLSIGLNRGNLIADRIRISFSNLTLNTNGLVEDSLLGRGYLSVNLGLFGIFTAHGSFLVTGVQGSNFDILFEGSDGSQTSQVTGQLLPNSTGFDMDLTFEIPDQFASDIRDTEQSLATATRLLVYLNPGLVNLPQAPGVSATISSSFKSEKPTAGSVLAKNASEPYTTLLPSPGAPVIQEIRPFDPSFRQEVTIMGSGFSATPSENKVTFAGVNGTRPEANVLAATSTSLTLFVPAGAASGPVRVERTGLVSNDHSSWMAFSPSIELALDTQAPGSATGLTVRLEEPAQQLATQSFYTEIDRGSWNYAMLAKDSKIGRSSGKVGLGNIFFDIFVEDTDGSTFANLIFKDSDGDAEDGIKMLLFNGENSGVGLQFFVADRKASEFSVFLFRSSRGTFTFDAAIFNTPSTGSVTCNTWLTSTPQVPGAVRILRAAMNQTLTIQ